MHRRAHAVNAVLLGLLVGGSLWAYPALPGQIPRHFGLGGVADAYWETTLARWLLLPLIAAGTVLSVYGGVWIMRTLPSSWVNVPNPEVFRALDAADRRAVRARMRGLLYWIAAPTLVMFGALQYGTYHVATTDATALPGLVNVLTVGSLVALLGLVALLVYRTRAWIEERAGGHGRQRPRT
jgi:uncharacterized membrane protein